MTENTKDLIHETDKFYHLDTHNLSILFRRRKRFPQNESAQLIPIINSATQLANCGCSTCIAKVKRFESSTHTRQSALTLGMQNFCFGKRIEIAMRVGWATSIKSDDHFRRFVFDKLKTGRVRSGDGWVCLAGLAMV